MATLRIVDYDPFAAPATPVPAGGPLRLEINGAAADEPKPAEAPEVKLRIVDFDPFAPPSLTKQIGRQLGLTARYAVEGGLALPSMVGDALGAGSSQAVSGVLDRIGLPKPEGAQERVVGDVARAMSGAGSSVGLGKVLAGAASPVTSAIGDLLSSGAGMQTISAGTGAGAAGATREVGGGPGAQTLAALAGALTPAAAQWATFGGLRSLMRSGEAGRQQTVERARDFRAVGQEPSVGQATGNRRMQAVDSTLSKTPGSAGVMARRAEAGAEAMGDRVAALADDLAPNTDVSKAGLTIKSGVKDFVQRFKSEQEFLYDKLDDFIARDTPVGVPRTQQALADLNASIDGAEEVSKLFKNSRIVGIEKALAADVGEGGALPYEALKKLRTLVGREMADSSLVADVPRSKWKALYAALSDDLGDAATAAGPKGEAAWKRANDFTRAGMQRIESYLDDITRPDSIEKVYRAALGDTQNSSKIAAMFKSLQPTERDVVRSQFIRRLGKATPGRQDDVGEVFSSETFLTNWNKIDERAKAVLFAGKDGQLRKDLDQVARVASMIRDGSKVFANPSGTAAGSLSTGAGISAGVAAATGNFGAAGAILGAMGMANVSARAMTNPRFVRWLAETTRMPAAALPAQLNALAQIARNESDPALRAEIERVSQAANTPAAR